MTDAWSYFLDFKGEQFELDGKDLTIGRSRTCDVSIKDPSVSRQHIRLTPTGGLLQLTDLGSSNGTFINGDRVQGDGELADGDILGLGDADVKIRIVQKAGFETIRMPRMPATGDEIPQVGEATSILQRESMKLAKETLGVDDSQAMPSEPTSAGAHMAPPAPAPAAEVPATEAPAAEAPPTATPPATFAGPPRPAPVAEPAPPTPGEETSFAGMGDDEAPSFGPPAGGFELPAEESPNVPSVDDLSPLATQVIPTQTPRGDIGNPKATIEIPLDIAEPETAAMKPLAETAGPPPQDLPAAEAPPAAPVPEPPPSFTSPAFAPPMDEAPAAPEASTGDDLGAATVFQPPTDVAPPAPPAPPPAPQPAAPQPAAPQPAVPQTATPQADAPAADPPAEKSGDELLPSLDGFDTTLGPGTPMPESMVRARENVAKIRSEEAEQPAPNPYEQPIQQPPMAGFGVRLVAVLLDWVWMAGLSAAAWFAGLEILGASVASALSFLVVLTGWAIWGTTPGKRMLGLYVCTADGQAGLGLARAALRMFAYMLSGLLLGVGFLMVLSSSKRGLHDRIADTYVRNFK